MSNTPAPDAVRLVPDDVIVRGLKLMAEHFKLRSPLQREFNVRGWPNMPATTSEALSECAAMAAERLAAAPAPATARGGGALSRWVATAETPFADGGLGDDLYKRGTAYLADYVLSTEGADHEPSEFERVLLEDAFAGLMGDEALFGPIRTVLAALASQPQATGGAVEREGWTGKKCPSCNGHGELNRDPLGPCPDCGGTGDKWGAIATQPAPSSGEVETLKTLLDNLVIAQSLSKEIRQTATDEARAYLYDLRHAAPSIQNGDEG